MRAHSDLEGVITEGAVQIGPFARLRPGTVLADGVHIGNFVETKKVTMGVDSKANHLTYLGDAVIGSKVNIGAGTITCNYDGVNKSQTTIGDGAFVAPTARWWRRSKLAPTPPSVPGRWSRAMHRRASSR